MPASLRHESLKTFRLDIRGLLLKSELDACQRRLVEELAVGAGAVKVLVFLDDFEGWEKGAAWNDLSFYAKYGNSIERIAIVGEERWRHVAMMFASADLRRAPVEFFREQNEAAARAWLSSDGPTHGERIDR
jgi:hypothetical protein